MESMKQVRPVKPVAPYIGGKRNLARRLIERIEAIDHTTYAEPFVGMGGVFFRRRQRPTAEVINDYSREVSTLFRVLQRHYVAFLEMMRYQLTTRVEFDRLSQTDPTTLTDLERAARFLYLQRTTFGGKVAGQTWGRAIERAARFDVTKLVPMLEDVHERLAGVVIECLPFEKFIAHYDRPETLFYLDPPYWGSEGDYGKEAFTRDDFGVLAACLRALQGRFILSLNDVPQVRETFAGFDMEEVTTTYTVQGQGKAAKAAELIISGGKGVVSTPKRRPRKPAQHP